MTAAGYRRWLVERVARTAGVTPGRIDPHAPFERLGLDSAAATTIAGELEERCGRPVPPTALYDHPTIAALAAALAREGTGDSGRRPAPTAASAPLDIAVVGIACRFPGADGPEDFWELLREGRCAIREVPVDRWDADAWYDPDPGAPERMTTRFGGFVEEIDRFDHTLFGIAAREARRIDPQQRMLLEATALALDDAGVPVERLRGEPVGVFVGISAQDWALVSLEAGETDPYVATGASAAIAANRISYALDLRGPSLTVDTACSSSLVAVHLACQSIASGESSLALAGGAGAVLSPWAMAAYGKLVPLCPDARCKAFAANADGVGRGEGAGLLVLRRLADALADGDGVYAVLRGSAVGQDGHSNGLTAPSRFAQERILRAAYRRSGVSPGDVGLIEAHGTGTPLGDPIEAAALGSVLSEDRPLDRVCPIGSVKTNLGHLEAAAGIAGLIKALLALQHAQVPPSLHFDLPNPAIPFERMPVRVATELAAWPQSGGRPRVAGVSAFGFGGTGAHAVLEEAPVEVRRPAFAGGAR